VERLGRDRHSSLFLILINYGQKSFITLTPDAKKDKPLFSLSPTTGFNKLECLFLSTQEVNGTVILPLLVFPVVTDDNISERETKNSKTQERCKTIYLSGCKVQLSRNR
jgi:hypothetical protein